MASKYKSYAYPQVEPGFAEAGLDEYERVSAGVAWSRTLKTVRKGFEMEVDLEQVWEDHVARELRLERNLLKGRC